MKSEQVRAKKPVFEFGKISLAFALILAIILIFTAADYLIHSLSEEYAVPSFYFRNKIIYGVLIGLVAYLVVRNKPLIFKSLIFSASIAVLLQARYFIEGYPLGFVLEFLVIHFLMLVVISYSFFRFAEV